MFISELGPNFIRILAFANGGARESELNDLRMVARDSSSSVNSDLIQKVVFTVQRVSVGLALIIFTTLLLVGTLTLLRPMSYLGHQGHGWLAWVVFCVGVSMTTYGNCYGCCLQGLGRVAMFRRWEGFVLLVSVLFGGIAVVLGLGLVGLVVSQQVVIVIGLFGRRYLAIQELRVIGCSMRGGIFDRNIFLLVWSKAWRTGSGVLMHGGVFHLTSLFYAQMARPELLASYLLAVKLLMAIVDFCKAPFYSKIPRLASLMAGGNDVVFLARKGMRFSYLIYVSGFIFMGIFGAGFLNFIGSNTEFVSPRLWALMGVAFFFERFAAMHLNLYTLSNHIIWHKVYLVSGVIYLATFSAAYREVGFYAYPLAILISEACFSSWYNAKHSLGLFKLRFVEFEKSVSFPALAIVALYVVIVWGGFGVS
jgi:hypothetical protein